MVTPSFCSASRCAAVKGLSHMKVFMAGATKSGREKSQALNCTVKDGMSYAACGVHNLALTECPPKLCVLDIGPSRPPISRGNILGPCQVGHNSAKNTHLAPA